MLKGKELGKAIAKAIELKIENGGAPTKAAIARHFGVKPPSVSDWEKKGSISKDKIPEMFKYFSDVVGYKHWGLLKAEWPTGLSNSPQNENSTPTPRVDKRKQKLDICYNDFDDEQKDQLLEICHTLAKSTKKKSTQ